MNAIDTTAMRPGTVPGALSCRPTHRLSTLTRIVIGIAWVVLTTATTGLLIDATFGYSSDPATAPRVTAPPASTGSAGPADDTSDHVAGPAPAPAPEVGDSRDR